MTCKKMTIGHSETGGYWHSFHFHHVLSAPTKSYLGLSAFVEADCFVSKLNGNFKIRKISWSLSYYNIYHYNICHITIAKAWLWPICLNSSSVHFCGSQPLNFLLGKSTLVSNCSPSCLRTYDCALPRNYQNECSIFRMDPGSLSACFSRTSYQV